MAGVVERSAFVELRTRVVEQRLDAVLARVPSASARLTPRVVDLAGDAVPELPPQLELQRVVVWNEPLVTNSEA